MMKNKRVYSLKQILVGQFLLVAAALVLLIILLLIFWRLPVSDGQTRAEQYKVAQISQKHIDSLLDQLNGQKEVFLEQLRSAKQQKELQEHFALKSLFSKELEGKALIEGVYILDNRFTVQELYVPKIDSLEVKHWVEADFSGLKWLKTQEKKLMKGLWSDRYESVVLKKDVIAVAQRINTHEILLLEVGLDKIEQWIDRLNEVDHLMILVFDQKGEVLAGPHTESGAQTNYSNITLVQAALNNIPSFDRFVFEGVEYWGSSFHLERLGGGIIVGYPVKVVSKNRNATLLMSVITVLFGLSVGIVLSVWVSKKISKEVQYLIHYSGSIAKGDYQKQRHEDHMIDELCVLESDMAQMVKAILKREQQLRILIDSSPSIAMVWFYPSGKVVQMNDAALQMYGCKAGRSLKNIQELLSYSDVQKYFERMGEVINNSSSPVEAWIYPLDGSSAICVLMNTFVMPDHSDQGDFEFKNLEKNILEEPIFVNVAVDITSRKKAESQLQELNAKLEERISERTVRLQIANDELQVALEQLQKAQQHMVESEKLVALGSMVAGIAHELNTPIGNSLMSSSTLKQKLQRFEKTIHAPLDSNWSGFIQQLYTGIDIMERNLSKATELIQSFKQISVDRASSAERIVNVKDLINDIVISLTPSIDKRIQPLHIQVPQELYVWTHPGPLGQCISNCISNAYLHAFENEMIQGHVWIDVQVLTHCELNTDAKWGALSGKCLEVSDQYVCIQIMDDGVGVSDGFKKRIFEPFFTTKLGQGGSGLGMAVAYNLLQGVLQGAIAVKDNDPKGTVFQMIIPYKKRKTT